jgi:hypothetical protein
MWAATAAWAIAGALLAASVLLALSLGPLLLAVAIALIIWLIGRGGLGRGSLWGAGVGVGLAIILIAPLWADEASRVNLGVGGGLLSVISVVMLVRTSLRERR